MPSTLFRLLVIPVFLFLGWPGIASAASGGPDSYGYYYADSRATGGIPYDATIFTTAVSSGTALTTAGGADDSSEAVTLPFSFTFYGTAYSTLYVCSNGYVSPTSTCTASNTSFSTNTQAMMAPYWDNLDTRASNAYVYTYTSGTTPNRIFNIVFIDVDRDPYSDSIGRISFAVQLYETTNLIVFQYEDVDFEDDGDYSNGRSATVGIDGGSTSGYHTQLSYDSASFLADSLAVAFSTTRAPIAEANGPYTAAEGVAQTISASGSVGLFGAISTYAFDCTTDGTYETSGSSASASCTYPDNGSYTVTVRVTNSTAVSATDTAAVTVSNVAPSITTFSTPSSAYEGVSASFSGAATDVAADTVTYTWNFGDGSTSTSASTTHTYADNGTYTVTLTATDEDGGTSSRSTTLSVANVAPSITTFSTSTSLAEGTAGSYAVVATDVAADTVTYLWDFGDGSTSTSASTTHAWANEGLYTVTATARDEDGGSSSRSTTVTVTNAAPTIVSMSLGSGNEGSALPFSATVTDPGTYDTLTYTWTWGDGSMTVTASASTTHTYVDDGTYTVDLDVSDGTDTASTSGTVAVANVAPTIASTPGLAATEGTTWTYAPDATDPGTADVLTWSLLSGPSGMTVDSGTGDLAWTPTYADALDSPAAVTLQVDDGDGGTDAQDFDIVVTALDSDGDGLPDGYEIMAGLDPYDPSDASADPDGDGISTLDEYAAGTDPNTYDGPSAPVCWSPVGGETVALLSPDLVVQDATSPRGISLTYEFEVYMDATATTLIAATAGEAEGPDYTTWTVDVSLPDDAPAYWRARAGDGYVDGPWSDLESFYVSTAGGAPTTPIPFDPIDDETVTSLAPTYTWIVATDPDGGALTYDVRVMDETLSIVVEDTSAVTDDGLDAYASWDSTGPLTDGATYGWMVRAVDDAGVEGAWSDIGWFHVSTENLAPSDVVWIDPVDADVLDIVNPVLLWSVSVDPEGTNVVYTVEDDVDPGFGTATAWSSDVNSLDLSAVGGALVENEFNWVRVRATDEDGLNSAWAVIELFVRGPNDPPGVPELVSPADGTSVADGAPLLTAAESFDPEGDAVTFDVAVSAASDLSDPVCAGTGLLAVNGLITWVVTPDLEPGTWYWSARASDELGATSGWAEPWTLVVEGERDSGETGLGPDSGGDFDTGLPAVEVGGSCGCQAAPSPAGLALGLLWLSGVAALARRRQRTGALRLDGSDAGNA